MNILIAGFYAVSVFFINLSVRQANREYYFEQDFNALMSFSAFVIATVLLFFMKR